MKQKTSPKNPLCALAVFCGADEFAECLAPYNDGCIRFDIDRWRHINEEPLKGLDITQQLSSILNREELLLILYEFSGQIELVVGTRGQTSLVGDLSCRYTESSLGPVQEIAAIEIAPNVCPSQPSKTPSPACS